MARDDVQLAFDIDLKTSQLASKLVALDKSVQRTSKGIQSASNYAAIFGKKHEDAARKAEAAMSKYQDTILEHTAEVEKAREKLATAVTAADKRTFQEAVDLSERAKDAAVENARKAADQSIYEAQRLAKEVKKALKFGETLDFGSVANNFTKKFEEETDWDKFRDKIGAELKDGLQEGFESFKGKDLSGIIKGGGKFAAGLLKGVSSVGGAGMIKGGSAVQKVGGRIGGAGERVSRIGESLQARGGALTVLKKGAIDFHKRVVDGGKRFVEAAKKAKESASKISLKGMGAKLKEAPGALKRGIIGVKDKVVGGVKGAADAGVGGAIKGVGGALKGMGGMFKSLGGIMKSIGPLLGTLAKMGPLLSASAAIFAGMVKVALDAEAAAKGMNKEILESADGAALLYNEQTKGLTGLNKAQVAYKNLDKTLDNIRDDATDIKSNLKYGMKAEDIINSTKAWQQQGASIRALTANMKTASDSQLKENALVQDFGDLARMGMVYSRMFGVSVSEITELQSEMFTDMGTSLSGIQLQFAAMAKDAADSGIASNKFFNIIRGISADLSLYTTRVGQAATMLKLLGKAMSPREAAKFMQAVSKGFKEMGEEDRLRMTLLAGEGKMRDVVAKDLSRKSKLMGADIKSNLGDSVKESADDIGKLIEAAKGGSKDAEQALNSMFDKLPKEMQGTMKSALSEMKMDTNALKKGGTMGTAEAASNLSAAGALTATKAALQRFGGNKKLKDMTGIQAFAARKAAGVSLEQFRGMAKLEGAVDDQKEHMVKLLKISKKDAKDRSADENQQLNDNKGLLARMDALKLNGEDAIKAADDDDIIAAMEASQQENLVAANEQKDYAAETAKATSTVADKMETIIEGIFEFLYVTLKDIFRDLNEFIELMAQLPGLKGADRSARESEKNTKNALRDVQDDKNVNVVKALRQTANDTENKKPLKDKMIDVIGPAMQKGMERAKTDPAHQKDIGEDIRSVLGYGLKQDSKRISQVADMMGLSDDKKKKFQEAMSSKDPNVANFNEAAKRAGFTAEDMQAFLAKSMWAMSPEELARVAPNLLTVQSGMEKPGKKAKDEREDRKEAAKPPEAPKPPPGAQAAGGTPATPASPAAQSHEDAKAALMAEQKKFDAAKAAGDTKAQSASVEKMAKSMQASGITPAEFKEMKKAEAAGPPAPMGGGLSKGDQALTSVMEDGSIDVVKNIQDLWDLMKVKGIKLNKSQTIETDFKKAIEDGSLAAIRKGLMEYALYTTNDPAKLIEQMKASGTDIKPLAEKYEDDPAHKEFLQNFKKNAEGGVVTSVQDGIAQIKRLPAGEGLASIGAGERIVPAGAGGGGGNPIQVNVNGIGGQDLANYLKVKVAEAIYEYKRREKFT